MWVHKIYNQLMRKSRKSFSARLQYGQLGVMNKTRMGACFLTDSFASILKSFTTGKPSAACVAGIQIVHAEISSANTNVFFMVFPVVDIRKRNMKLSHFDAGNIQANGK